jgi:hypothetical protein
LTHIEFFRVTSVLIHALHNYLHADLVLTQKTPVGSPGDRSLLASQGNLVQVNQAISIAAYDDPADILEIYSRVQSELLQKTPAGQYYESLLWRHGNEICQIMQSHPEHNYEIAKALIVFAPEVEALLNGEGEKVYVSSQHVEILQRELDWFFSRGSAALREDIQKEQQRLPLDDFVGMTMSEAWDFINSKWTPDMVTQPTPTPEASVPVISTPYKVDLTLVPGSDGKWAYYVHNGVYLEYPSSFYRFPSGYNDQFLNGEPVFPAMRSINFHPYEWQDIQQMPYSIEVAIWKGSLADQERLIHGLDASGGLVWTRTIQTGDFDGIEYVTGESSSVGMQLGATLFNQEDELIINMFVTGFSPVPSDSDFGVLIDQRYSYFQHMIDHLRIPTPSSYE